MAAESTATLHASGPGFVAMVTTIKHDVALVVMTNYVVSYQFVS